MGTIACDPPFSKSRAPTAKGGYTSEEVFTRQKRERVGMKRDRSRSNGTRHEILAMPTVVRADELLTTAAFRGEVERVRDMLDHGAATNARDGKTMTTALHWAVSMGHLEVAELLLQRGAEVDARATDGSTPLHAAAREGDDETAEFLLDHGANPSICTAQGKTALDLALDFADEEVELVDRLRTAQALHDQRLLTQRKEAAAAAAAKPKPKVQIVYEADLLAAAAAGGAEGAVAAETLAATRQVEPVAFDASAFSGNEEAARAARRAHWGLDGPTRTDEPAAAAAAAAVATSPEVTSSSEASAAAFIAASSFAGARPNYVFKAGSRGLGYYREAGPVPAAKAVDIGDAGTSGRGPSSSSSSSGIGGVSGASANTVSDIDAKALSSVADKLMAWSLEDDDFFDARRGGASGSICGASTDDTSDIDAKALSSVADKLMAWSKEDFFG